MDTEAWGGSRVPRGWRKPLGFRRSEGRGSVVATTLGAILLTEACPSLGTEIPALRRVVMPVIGGAMATG